MKRETPKFILFYFFNFSATTLNLLSSLYRAPLFFLPKSQHQKQKIPFFLTCHPFFQWAEPFYFFPLYFNKIIKNLLEIYLNRIYKLSAINNNKRQNKHKLMKNYCKETIIRLNCNFFVKYKILSIKFYCNSFYLKKKIVEVTHSTFCIIVTDNIIIYWLELN